MKILHTSDWHIGHNFFNIERNDEFLEFFKWIKQIIIKENIDILLISGDIFDVYYPSSDALKLYYDFLVSVKNILKKVIIVGGNHDSVKTLNAPKEILKYLDVIVVSGGENDFCEVIEFDDFNIVAVPYLREGILKKHNLNDIYASKLVPNKKNIAMGHFGIDGVEYANSEREIGGLGVISKDIFDGYDYVALGHIHKPQNFGNIVYSGSVLALNFKETYEKKIVILDTDTFEYKWVTIPKFREFVRLKGSLEEVLKSLETIKPQSFVEIEFDEVVVFDNPRDDIYITKIIMPYVSTSHLNIKNLTLDNIVEEIFKDDKELDEIKQIIKEAQYYED